MPAITSRCGGFDFDGIEAEVPRDSAGRGLQVAQKQGVVEGCRGRKLRRCAGRRHEICPDYVEVGRHSNVKAS